MITWINKRTTPNSRQDKDHDVAVRLHTSGKKTAKRHAVCIWMYNGVEKQLSQTEYIAIGVDIDTDRMYLKSSAKHNGFKISCTSTTPCAKFSVEEKSLKFWMQREGTFKLKKDETNNMYYIDLSEVKK